MLKRLQVYTVIVAWFLATGAQWDLLQVFAWARMFAGYVQKQSVGAAIEATFAPKNACRWCKAAQAGRRAQPQEPVAESKTMKVVAVVMVTSCPVVRRHAPTLAWPDVTPLWGSLLRDRPPVPPPRCV